MEQVNKDKDTAKTNQKACGDALEKCRAETKVDVLKKASKLSAAERLSIIQYFKIPTHELGSTIIAFWLRHQKSASSAETLLNEAFYTE